MIEQAGMAQAYDRTGVLAQGAVVAPEPATGGTG